MLEKGDIKGAQTKVIESCGKKQWFVSGKTEQDLGSGEQA